VDSLGRIAKSWAIKKPSFGRDTNLIFALSDYVYYKNYFKEKDTKTYLDSLERLVNRTKWNVGKGLLLWSKCNYAISFEQDKGPKAINLATQALDLLNKERNPKALFYANLRMASIMLWNVKTNEKQKLDGLNFAKKSVEYARAAKDTSLICHGLAYVANHLEGFRKLNEGLERLAEGEALIKKAKVSYFAENLIYGTMAALYADLANKTKTLEYIDKTLASGLRENDLYSIGSMLQFKAYLTSTGGKTEDLKKSIPLYEESLKYAKQQDEIAVVARVEEKLYGTYKYLKDWPKAFEYLELFTNHQKTIDQKSIQKAYADFDISSKELKIKELENEQLNKDKALKILENQSLLHDRNAKIKELNFLKLLKINTDSLASQKEEKLLTQVQLASKENTIKSLENAKLKTENEKKTNERNLLIASILAGVVLVSYVLYTNRNLKNKNQELVNKNREIEEALLKGTLQERKRVASELHDNLSAKISGIRMRMEAIKPVFNTEKEEKIYQSSVNAVAEVYTDVRLISHNLLPADLETKGLKFALSNLIDELNGLDKAKFSLSIPTNLPKIKSKIEYELFSIILELSNNIMKHSGAQMAEINLQNTDNQLILTVKDNGMGFSETENKKGMGFANLQSRVESMKGQIKISNSNGVKVEIVVPV
jgi:signal transduction histidine kinase